MKKTSLWILYVFVYVGAFIIDIAFLFAYAIVLPFLIMFGVKRNVEVIGLFENTIGYINQCVRNLKTLIDNTK